MLSRSWAFFHLYVVICWCPLTCDDQNGHGSSLTMQSSKGLGTLFHSCSWHGCHDSVVNSICAECYLEWVCWGMCSAHRWDLSWSSADRKHFSLSLYLQSSPFTHSGVAIRILFLKHLQSVSPVLSKGLPALTVVFFGDFATGDILPSSWLSPNRPPCLTFLPTISCFMAQP